MIFFTKRLDAFERLGKLLKEEVAAVSEQENEALSGFEKAKAKALAKNAWFTLDNIDLMLSTIVKIISAEQLKLLANSYQLETIKNPKTVAVIMAGNIPMVGFHDFLSVLVSGHRFLGKLSSEDPFLLPALAEILLAIEPEFKDYITFSETPISGFDAVIATGSDNTTRYFNYYFGKYPNLIRGNRNGIAILNGSETKEELQQLGIDIFSFFGLGCRNVSSLFVPASYDFNKLFEALETFEELKNHSKYFNNYEYNKAIWLINGEPHFDNGFVLLKKAAEFSSAVSVLHFQQYSDTKILQKILDENQDKIQCIVSQQAHWPGSCAFGQAQMPAVLDYADGLDTLNFLLEI